MNDSLVGINLTNSRMTAVMPAIGDVCINGRFLTQHSSGVQRFSRQLVCALDAELSRESLGDSDARRWLLLIPRGVRQIPTLRHIEVRTVGAAQGHLWDQLLRFHCKEQDILINLANSGPVLRARSISILHDAAVFRTPQNFTRAYRVLHQWLGKLIARRALIGTVSEFSRRELQAVLGLKDQNIFLVPNSCEHLHEIVADNTILRCLNVELQRYFLAIGSPVANKNIPAAIAAFTRLAAPGQKFVVVGAVDTAVFGRDIRAVPTGVVLAGAISDAQVKALLQHATALVFPSLYEGFGIPPLEAMLNGCPVIASNIPPVTEVCGDAALYFNPTDVTSIEHALRRALNEPELLQRLSLAGEARATLYSWRRSARRLMTVVEELH